MASSARLRNRLLAGFVSCALLLPCAVEAQVPGLRRTPETLLRATSSDTITGIRRHLPAPLHVAPFRLEALFVTRPLASWLDEWRETSRFVYEPGARRYAREQFLREGASELADNSAAALIAPPDTSLFLPPGPVRRPPAPPDNPLGGLVGEYADLGLAIHGQGDLGGAWTRHKPCDPAVYFNCNPGLMPDLKPDVKFGIVVGGTISERVHIDVDYDQSREFDAANNINVYYQGLTDEVLQRVEMGDVSIRLPSSRYLTRGIPAGNFGFMASGQVGPLELQTVFAQQKGDLTSKEFRFSGGEQSGVEQDAELVIDDADYVKGQFFFVVPPAELAGTPHVDALSLRSTDAPASVRPGLGGNLQLYRDERLGGQSGGASAQLGYFLAEGVPPGGSATQRHTGSFRRLQPEVDYIVHSSGLWIMLRSPLRPDEALAVSFLTETGDTVGVLNAESTPPGVTPRLRLLRGPYATHQPGYPTWDMEMHQVYRLDSSTDVDLANVDLAISLGGLSGGRTFRQVLGQQVSFLRFFGLDEDAPSDRLDAGQVYQPARDSFGGGAGTPIGGTYVIFPTLRPFARPPPVQSERLSAEDLLAALDRDANPAIYFDPDPVTRDAAGRFRLNFKYRVKVEGIQSSFSLGAIGLREGSERLYIGGRQLTRDVDYIIDYDLGSVTLKDPQGLFATSPGAEIRATWEQKPLFNIAPTSMAGFHARYQLGSRGDINVVGLYQAQASLMSRPQLGIEPGSTLLGGLSGTFNLGGALVDRVVNVIPGMRSTRASAVSLTGELAFSAPDPNPRGVAYLDDFENSDEIRLSPNRRDWRLGSAPQSTEASRGMLPFVADASSAVPLVWQDTYVRSDGQVSGPLPPTSIDALINTIGTISAEPVMWLFWGTHAPRPPGLPEPPDARRWRSITTVLSTTGRDMTRTEYLEFYVGAARTEPLALIFDVGTVSEDAMHVDSLGRTNGRFDDGRDWGLGILDEEARLIDREVWGNDRDQRGLWDQPCRAEPIVTYPRRDPRANCTRGNGINDTEDLNGDGILDPVDGQYFRYVVRLDENSEYLVRDTMQTGTSFRLYRIPLRSGDAINGASDATWRFIRHLRMTVAGEPTTPHDIQVARMRLVGSRWTKRDVHGVMRGLLDAETGSGLTDVRVGPVSQLTDGTRYQPPPGVTEEAQDRTQQYGTGGIEVNEKGLRLAYTDLEPGERAEVYFRYPQQPRNMLMYSELRLWALARSGRWGVDDGERLTVRVGTDPSNFYLYQSKLRPATGDSAFLQRSGADWLPELVIDTREWQVLKAEAEKRLIERPRTAGVDTVWSADSAYAVVLEDRARAPNLAAVRELVFAVYNAAGVRTSGEVWLNDLRTNVPDRRRDMAGNIGLDVVAGDLATGSVSFANYGGLYRQLNETPSYLGGTQLSVNTDVRLDRLLPARWGVDLPLSVQHNRSDDAPLYLQQSDVLADRLDNLRESGSRSTRVGLRVSKRTPTANPLLSLLLDGSALRLGWNSGSNSTVTSRGEQSGFTGDLSYRRDLAPRTLPLPGLGDILRGIAPERVEGSDVFRRLAGARLRWSPANLSFGSGYNDQLTRSLRYERILEIPGDTQVALFESPRQALRNDAQLGFQFFQPLTLTFGLSSERDLLASQTATSRAFAQQALERERLALGGLDLGWETSRSLATVLNFRPQFTTWLRGSYTYDNRYVASRNPSFLELYVSGADTTAELQRRFDTSRRTTRTIGITPRTLAPALGLDSTRLAARLMRRINTVDLSWNRTLTSAFEREVAEPGVAYKLGLGDLESFSIMNGDTAVRAQELGEVRIGTGIEMVRGLTLNASYGMRDLETFDPRTGNRAQQDRTPSASLIWRDVRLPAFAARYITAFSGSVGITLRETESFFRADNEQRRSGTDLTFPFSVNVGFPRAITMSYNGSLAAGETIDPTGSAERGTFQHNFRVSTIFQPPERWRTKLNGPIELQLNYIDQQQRQCRFVPGLALADGCVAFIDVGTRTANLQVSSKLSDLDVGMLLNYVGRDNAIGMRNGSTQFQLQMYARFNFTAGRMPDRMLR